MVVESSHLGWPHGVWIPIEWQPWQKPDRPFDPRKDQASALSSGNDWQVGFSRHIRHRLLDDLEQGASSSPRLHGKDPRAAHWQTPGSALGGDHLVPASLCGYRRI